MPARAKERDRGAVGGGQGVVGHEDDDVGLGDRRPDVARDPSLHRVVALGVEASGVDERVLAAECAGVGVVAVARDAWLVVDDGELGARPGG